MEPEDRDPGTLLKLTPQEAIGIQKRLREKVSLRWEGKPIRRIAGADASYYQGWVFGVVAVFSYPELTELEEGKAVRKVDFPYIPGLLAFREGPVIKDAFHQLSTGVDIMLLDGQGIAHPRGVGLATQLGIELDLPTIGCAKSRLWGNGEPPPRRRGECSPLLQGEKPIGAILRTRDGVRPLWISPGHKVSLKVAIEVVLGSAKGYRLPEPLRAAHRAANRLRENFVDEAKQKGGGEVLWILNSQNV